MNQHCVDTAFNFYRMALNKGLTRGRRSLHVAAACIYMVCRTEGTPHMLLDLSDLVQVNVYVLGKTFLTLARELCINAPAIDPCLYIPRFAQMLEFGEKNHEVSMTALRLVQRMKRDWMHTGRRPSGLCGAALLVAARMYEFRRTIKEIVDVVKVCETTLRKRLNEFEDTPTSHMTIEEFMKLDLDQECDPPCFTAGIRKKKYQGLAIELKKQMDDEIEDEIHEFEDEIDAELQNSRPKLKGIYAAYTREVPVQDLEEAMFVATKVDEEEEDELQAVAKHFGRELDELTIEALRKLEQPLDSAPCGEEEGAPERVGNQDQEGVPKRNAPTLEYILGPIRSTAALGLSQSISHCITEHKDKDAETDGGELDLSGIDDEEIELYLLNDREIQIKTALWMAENSDYLKEQREKEAKIAKEKELGIYKERKRRAPGSRKRDSITANSTGEAIGKMLEAKKISSKINYDVLKDLNVKPGSSPATVQEEPQKTPKLTPRAKRAASQPLTLSTPLSTLGKRLQPFISGHKPPPKKKALDQGTVEAGLPLPVAVSSSSGALVESGPVVYEEEPEEEEEEEEEGGCVSAMELLGATGYGSDVDDDDY
ncbi:transcription factor IIIB 90 kDa subunit-like [Periophthalmus magnuspinnatus]|uniref:transcription factor IIIB 90 kDa subunit-like n=1 Tax=Periophthalmus magnuspinnatus TaxID=409849 RepID=UPI002436FD8E|nr:transcription factor IIIB 90 kDa subunit-like [Periophthalmus magnuspinnatus]